MASPPSSEAGSMSGMTAQGRQGLGGHKPTKRGKDQQGLLRGTGPTKRVKEPTRAFTEQRAGKAGQRTAKGFYGAKGRQSGTKDLRACELLLFPVKAVFTREPFF